MYQGNLKPEALLGEVENADEELLQYVTQGYGLGNFYLAEGDTSKATEVFEKVIKSGYWAAFGYIAAEMELSKLGK
jgi:hypothetical protein